MAETEPQVDPTDEHAEDILESLGLHPAQLKVQEHLANLAGQGSQPPVAPAQPGTAPPRMSASAPVAPPVAGPIAEPGAPKLSPPLPGAGAPVPIKRPSMFSEGENNFSQKHHFWGGVLKGLDVAGSILAPGAMQVVPGTMLNQKVKDASANNTAKAQTEQSQAQANLKKTQIETQAMQDKPGAPSKPLYDQAGDLIGFQVGDELLGPNNPKLTQDMRDMMAAAKGKAATPKEGELPLGERVSQLNQMLTTRFQVLNPGHALPSQYTLPANATQKDYDRIDKSMEATERATGTRAQQDQVNAFRQQTLAMNTQKKTAEENGIEAAARTIAKMDPSDLSSLKDISSMRGEQRLLIYNRAKEINPNFNIAEVNRKVKMMDNFTNGKDGQALQSFGTFLEHAGAASAVIDSVRAKQSDIPLLNKTLNWWKQNMAGDPRYTQLIASLEPVKTEAENFMLNGHAMHVEDKKAVDAILSEDSSPAQMQAAIKQLGHTVQARFTEMNHRYKGVMKQDIPEAFSDEAIAGATKIGLNIGTNQGGGKTLSQEQLQQAAKDHGVSVDEAKKQAIAAGYQIK